MIARILNIILALLIFISSSGFIVNKHYCQNELRNMAIFVQPMSCHDMAKMPTSCPKYQKMKACKKHAGENEEENNCCQNQAEYIALDQDQQIKNIDLEVFKNPAFIASVFILFNIDLPTIDNASLHYLNYKPPLIVCDFPSSLQTYLL